MNEPSFHLAPFELIVNLICYSPRPRCPSKQASKDRKCPVYYSPKKKNFHTFPVAFNTKFLDTI